MFRFSTYARLYAAIILAFGIASPALAQDWPTRRVQIVVSSGAGGTADIVARLIGDRLSTTFGQPFVIENVPGAGGMVGTQRVAGAPADGYTLLVSGSPTHAIGPHLYKLSFDPLADVPPVAMLGVAPNLLVVNSRHPGKSVADLVQLAHNKTGGLNYSSAGVGTTGHLAGEMLKQLARIDLTHVPHKTGPEALTSVLSGVVDFSFFTVPATLPLVSAGDMRALAITSAKRSPLAPNVPTVIESGYPSFEVLGWFALLAPRGLPTHVTVRIEREVKNMLAQPDMRERFAKLGAEPHFLGQSDSLEFARKDASRWGDIIRAAKLTGKQ